MITTILKKKSRLPLQKLLLNSRTNTFFNINKPLSQNFHPTEGSQVNLNRVGKI